MRKALKSLSGRKRRQKSQRILKKILQAKLFKRSQHILLYVSSPVEVRTRALIQQALRLGKHVYLPAVDTRRKQIRIYQIKSLSKDLRRGPYGIFEPRRLRKRQGNPKYLDWIAVPGIGFDRSGGRLGHGIGYFDRFLKKAKRAQKVGLAFREQMCRKIPMERHDVRMDQVSCD